MLPMALTEKKIIFKLNLIQCFLDFLKLENEIQIKICCVSKRPIPFKFNQFKIEMKGGW